MDKIKWMRGDLIQQLLMLSDVLMDKAKRVSRETGKGFFSDPVRPDFLDDAIKDLQDLREVCCFIYNRQENPILFRKFGRIS